MAIGPIAIAIGSNTGNLMSRGSIKKGLNEVALAEREQPLPMPLRRVAGIDRALGEGKTVMRAGIDLDLVPGALHAFAHLVDDLLRRIDVGLGAGEIELGLGL